MMVGKDRGDAAFEAVQANNPNMAKLSSAELSKMKAYFESLLGADTTYIVDNMDVLPAALSGTALNNPAGQPISSPAGPGATSAPEPIQGMGSVQ